jgi:peptide deformylase
VILVPYTTPALRRPAKEVERGELKMHANSITLMKDLMEQTGAAGITAPSVGIDLRFFVTRFPGFPVVVNPMYSDVSVRGYVSKPEGSALRPGFSTYVRRCDRLDTIWYNENFEHQEIALNGMDARVFAHFCDSLHGDQIWE